MKLFIEESEIEEIPLLGDISLPDFKDKGRVIVIKEEVGKRNEGIEDLQKEIIANDALMIGPARASKIHGVPESSASKYKDGLDIKDEDTRIRVMSNRYNIADKAIASLMDTLNLFDPNGIETQLDVVKSASLLAGIVNKITPGYKNGNGKGGPSVVLNLYAPKQNAIEKYEVIDV